MTSYDAILYPTAVFSQTAPDRQATVARLQRLEPPPVDDARVLEIGCGDGLNLIALAAAYPRARFTGFDLAASVVERGRGWIASAGLTNIRLEVRDIAEAADAVAGPFDYVIAHGVYAWVPDHVRVATMALIGRVLAPGGVAFLSYNTMPGGHLRLMLREMLLHHLEGVSAPRDRIARAKAFLADYVQPRDGDEAMTAVMRRFAASIGDRADEVLYHDELGEHYHPQLLMQVARHAEAHGLRYLADAVGPFADDFFPVAAGGDEAAFLRMVQARDHVAVRSFRSSLLVRADQQPSRHLAGDAVRALYASTRAERSGDSEYRLLSAVFRIADAGLDAALRSLVDAWPARVPVAELFDDEPHLLALVRLCDAGLVELHAGPAPYAVTPGARPLASALARMQIARGEPLVCTLDQRMIALDDPAARAFIMLLDGTRDHAALARAWEASGFADCPSLELALRSVARIPLLLA